MIFYYKIVYEGKVVGIATSDDLRRVQAKHNILIISTVDEAQYIQVDETLYRDSWFKAITSDRYPYLDATITVINFEEYETLKAEFSSGEEIYEKSAEEEATEPIEEQTDISEPAPLTPVVRIAQLEEELASLQETNAMLTDCLLEMSEIVYGG